ncbi:F-box domain containing protein [Tanacetum coccineum]
MEENTIDTTDRISMLPDSIVHHILSYLLDDPKSRVRMSVLSKGWFALTESFPILHFNLYGAGFYPRYENFMENFCEYVQYTVYRFCNQNISAHTLNMFADIINIEQIELFGHCLDLVLEKGLQVMDIHFQYYPENLPMFCVPNMVLSASSLTSLALHNCELPSSLMVGVVKFKSLRLLSLSHLPIDEGVIEYLTKGCPILEEIYLRYCYGFKTFCVKRHRNLQKVEIYCDRRFLLERIDVEAPNLSSFEVIDVEKLKVIQSPPRELEHVELINAVGINKVSVYATVLDAVLWCCRPRSLTLEVGQFADTSDIVKYTYEKLLQQEDEGQTNINFVMLLSSQDKQHFSDLNSLLKALSLEQEKIKQYFGNEEIFITFIKEEGDAKSVTLVSIGGNQVIRGGNAIADNFVNDANVKTVMESVNARGFGNSADTSTKLRNQKIIFRFLHYCIAYANIYGPTVGDKIRLGDTDLFAEVEKDFAVYSDECVFGGGKVIRAGMGQASGYSAFDSGYPIASGITTMIGGGTGSTEGTRATTCTPGSVRMKLMLEATDDLPMNFGFTEKVYHLHPYYHIIKHAVNMYTIRDVFLII